MKHFQTVMIAICAGLAMAATAAASDFDGSKKLLCAPSDVFECGPAINCQRSNPETVNIPRFIQVDVKKKKLSGAGAGGDEVTTSIQNVATKDGKLTLQGAENARAWSLVIDQETGLMSASITDNIEGFLLFGACTVLR